MANNYCQFSGVIPCMSIRGIEWLENELAAASGGYPACDFNRQEKGLWVYSEDNADLEALVGVVCEFQRKYHIHEPWSLAWAYTCSKPRVGEFGGGGVVVYKGEAEWIDAKTWCEIRVAEKIEERNP